MIEVQKKIEKLIIKALGELDIEADKVHLEHPVDLSMGDYSTNVAMVYAKKLGKNPREFAVEFAEKIADSIQGVEVKGLNKQKNSGLKSNKVEYFFTNFFIKKMEIAGPGFINFYLNESFFEENIKDILKAGEKYGSNENLKGQKILIEHSSPNLFKEFHIGHMVNNSIGESISRIIKNEGANTKVISYPSDVGLGIAKTVWAILNPVTKGGDYEKMLDFIKNGSVDNEIKEKYGTDLLQAQINILGQCYVFGNESYKNNENAKKQIDEINKKIYDKSDKEINKIYNEGKKLTLEYFEKIIARLGSKFDDYIFESEAGEVGKEIVKENIGKVFEESEGAVIFKGENFDENLHTRVFLNSTGLPTYEAKDLGLLKLKFDKYSPNKSIFITDNEQNEYMKVMLKAAEQINLEWTEKTKHIGHGRLRFPEGRLSSREGNVLTVVDLLEEVKDDVLSKMDNFEGDKEKTAEQISVGAVKYTILKSSAGKNIIFDKEKALALEGNSGPYLQYTYARAKSVIDKAESEGIKSSSKKTNEEILDIEKLLYRFPEVVERAGEEYEPHYIATYLFELAQAFNSYYGNNKIADKSDENAPYKVALTEAVAQTIKNGLWLLGIEAPERL
ncbi:arginine--tRNA ligase [Patescibacteria group bacterium]|nr:arginine--tRNA ligase [Patescibacteria group bacterium]